MLLLNGSRLSQVAKAADGARDGRVPPIAVETQKITRSWSVADDDNSVYFLLKQVNYFRLKHVFLAKKKRKKKKKNKIHSTRQAQLVHHGYLGSHKADPVGFG